MKRLDAITIEESLQRARTRPAIAGEYAARLDFSI